MVLRGCLEAGLYAHFLYRDPASRGPVWHDRHRSDKAQRRMRTMFSYGAVLRSLEEHSATLAERVRSLYERTIDYGGHPNERAFLQSMSLDRANGGDFQVTLNYLADGCPAYRVCIQVVADGALCSLEIFRLVFYERFELIGLSDTLAELRAGFNKAVPRS